MPTPVRQGIPGEHAFGSCTKEIDRVKRRYKSESFAIAGEIPGRGLHLLPEGHGGLQPLNYQEFFDAPSLHRVRFFGGHFCRLGTGQTASSALLRNLRHAPSHLGVPNRNGLNARAQQSFGEWPWNFCAHMRKGRD